MASNGSKSPPPINGGSVAINVGADPEAVMKRGAFAGLLSGLEDSDEEGLVMQKQNSRGPGESINGGGAVVIGGGGVVCVLAGMLEVEERGGGGGPGGGGRRGVGGG